MIDQEAILCPSGEAILSEREVTDLVSGLRNKFPNIKDDVSDIVGQVALQLFAETCNRLCDAPSDCQARNLRELRRSKAVSIVQYSAAAVEQRSEENARRN